jgi:hypothetical protein
MEAILRLLYELIWVSMALRLLLESSGGLYFFLLGEFYIKQKDS